MHSQKLNHRVRFDQPTTQVGDLGHRQPTWAPVCAPVWAAIRPVGSTERLAAAQVQSGQTHVITVRHSPALAALRGECRIVYGARSFGIVGFPRNIDEGGRWLLFDCTEGGADGH